MKMSVNIPDQEVRDIRELSERSSLTMTDVIRQGIRVLKTLDQAQRDGKEIVLRDPSTKTNERLVIL